MNEADDDEDDDVPDLVENFDEACKDEVPSNSNTDESNAVILENDAPKKGNNVNEADADESDDVPDLMENVDEACKEE